MNINLTEYPQLQSALKQKKNIVYLCGAGLSMALGSHRHSWYNWITAQVNICRLQIPRNYKFYWIRQKKIH